MHTITSLEPAIRIHQATLSQSWAQRIPRLQKELEAEIARDRKRIALLQRKAFTKAINRTGAASTKARQRAENVEEGSVKFLTRRFFFTVCIE